MVSNRKFLVSKDILISTFTSKGPTMLDTEKVTNLLNSGQNVYVFDTREAAYDFATKVGAGQPDAAASPFSLFASDVPVFEVEAEDIPSQPKVLKAVKGFPSGHTRFTHDDKPYRAMTVDTTYQNAVGLKLLPESIKGVSSAQGYDFAMNGVKSDCRLM